MYNVVVNTLIFLSTMDPRILWYEIYTLFIIEIENKPVSASEYLPAPEIRQKYIMKRRTMKIASKR